MTVCRAERSAPVAHVCASRTQGNTELSLTPAPDSGFRVRDLEKENVKQVTAETRVIRRYPMPASDC